MMSTATMKRLDSMIYEVRTATRMKDLAGVLIETAEDTGYDYDFLSMLHHEAVEDGEDIRKALINIITIAYEQDF